MGNPTIDPSKKARGSNRESLRQKKEEKMQKPPQIIVIPQSMLAGQKSLLRLAPMPRNTSPLPSYHPPPSPPYSLPALALLQQWSAASDLPHLRHHQRISFWTSRRNRRRMRRQRGREQTWTT